MNLENKKKLETKMMEATKTLCEESLKYYPDLEFVWETKLPDGVRNLDPMIISYNSQDCYIGANITGGRENERSYYYFSLLPVETYSTEKLSMSKKSLRLDCTSERLRNCVINNENYYEINGIMTDESADMVLKFLQGDYNQIKLEIQRVVKNKQDKLKTQEKENIKKEKDVEKEIDTIKL